MDEFKDKSLSIKGNATLNMVVFITTSNVVTLHIKMSLFSCKCTALFVLEGTVRIEGIRSHLTFLILINLTLNGLSFNKRLVILFYFQSFSGRITLQNHTCTCRMCHKTLFFIIYMTLKQSD